jgi:uncharacterized protein (TIGR03382 family)
LLESEQTNQEKEIMKKLFVAAALSASLGTAGIASAATYQLLNNSANYSPMHNSSPYFAISSWNAVLTANPTGNSTLIGTAVGSNGTNYNINMTFFNTYLSGGNQYWQSFTGTLTAVGSTTPLINFFDVSGPGKSSDDAVLGINATPYNNNIIGGNAAYMEFGFWGTRNPNGSYAAGERNSDVNVQVRCISGNGPAGPADSQGRCTTGPNPVPLPGTLALLGLGLAAAGVARRRASQA